MRGKGGFCHGERPKNIWLTLLKNLKGCHHVSNKITNEYVLLRSRAVPYFYPQNPSIINGSPPLETEGSTLCLAVAKGSKVQDGRNPIMEPIAPQLIQATELGRIEPGAYPVGKPRPIITRRVPRTKKIGRLHLKYIRSKFLLTSLRPRHKKKSFKTSLHTKGGFKWQKQICHVRPLVVFVDDDDDCAGDRR